MASEHSVLHEGSGTQQAATANTRIEDNQIVTPYAFEVAPELLGKPLATPLRRGWAQFIDVTLVFLISSSNPMILALLAAATFLRAGSNLAQKPKRSLARQTLRLGSAILIATVVFFTIDSSPSNNNRQESLESELSTLVTGVEVLAWETCEDDFTCLNVLSEQMGERQADEGVNSDKQLALQQALVDETSLSEKQKKRLMSTYVSAFKRTQNVSRAAPSKNATDSKQSDVPDASVTELPAELSGDSELERASPAYKIFSELKDLIVEFGSNFGWAALYYSVFTAWLGGYTPGKWLLGIRVMRLDGRTPTLWESFGRYGGYGAGLATGFLGFFQIFWDPNRQAIQDKIAETLVVRQPRNKRDVAPTGQQTGVSGEGI